MHKKHLPIFLILLGLLDLTLILYIRLIFLQPPISPQLIQLTNQLINSQRTPSPTPTINNKPASTAKRGEQKAITLTLVGDVMLGREVDFQSRKLGNLYAFEKIKDITNKADLTFGNLESPFFEGCQETHGGFTFCARPAMIEGLLASGFDVLSIENNHNLNYGKSGKQQTIDLLTQNNILPSSTQLVIKTFPACDTYGTYDTCDTSATIGFLSFDLTVSNNPDPVLQAVTESRSLVDVLVVSLHWGVEYEKTPRDWQIKLAHEIIDAGADIIAGSHPHVTQSVEQYNDGLIYYSLGNFIFDQMWSEETKKGMITKITIEDNNIISHQEIPTYTRLIGQPEITVIDSH